MVSTLQAQRSFTRRSTDPLGGRGSIHKGDRLWIEVEVRLVDNDQRLKSSDQSTKDHANVAQSHLERARACAKHCSTVDEGWQHVSAADLELIYTFTDREILETAPALDKETRGTAKISRWRQEAIQAMLQPILCDAGMPSEERGSRSRQQMLRCAMRLGNQGTSGWFWKLRIIRRHQIALVVIAFTVLAAFIPMLVMWFEAGTDASLKSWHAPVLAAGAGVLGAVVSAAQRSTKFEGTSIPLLLVSYAASLSRIPLGAIAGLTAWLLALSTGAEGTSPEATMLLAAFGAGFAERLVVDNRAPVPTTPDLRLEDRPTTEDLRTVLEDLRTALNEIDEGRTPPAPPAGTAPAQPIPAAGQSVNPGAPGGA